MFLGQIYGPADLYYGHDPWKHLASEYGVTRIQNGILSDLAFANFPWRAAVREAVVNGRFPSWNRFVLAGSPLHGNGSPAVFHPSTWFGLFLPVALSWTFSCTLTIFLSLLCAYLFLRDFHVSALAAGVGAVAWGFSTYLLFWNGWSVGMSTASFPLLLLGLRRIAGHSAHGFGLTATAMLLSVAGGHPESFFHSAVAAGVYFLWELAGRQRSARIPAIRSAVLASLLAFLLAAPMLFPLLEAISHSAEYRARQTQSASGQLRQSVGAAEATGRLLPSLLPFAYGIYGQSPVQIWRGDGSGVPLGYNGALLFPLCFVALFSREPSPRGRWLFLGFLLVGLLQGASAPGLLDLLTRLPGFRFALNYRMVFLAALGYAGLAAFGADQIGRLGSRLRVAMWTLVSALVLAVAFVASRGVFQERGLSETFLRFSFAAELVPLLLLLAATLFFPVSGRSMVGIALVLLAGQRVLEMGNTCPTLPAETLAPRLPTLASLPRGGEPYRVVATQDVLRPNGATLYGLEDVRGYEALILDRFVETYPLWSKPEPAFNRVDDLGSPFLAFLNVRYAIASPGASVPAGWREHARGPEMAIFEDPRALPRAFVPRRIRREPDGHRTLVEMGRAANFSDTAWIEDAGHAEEPNGSASVSLRCVGPDLVVSVAAAERVLVATSLPNWPGWVVESGEAKIPVVTLNHAFVGFWLAAGRHEVRLTYTPASFRWGLAAALAGLGFVLVRGVTRSRPR